MQESHLAVLVYVHVRPGEEAAFRAASLANAAESIKEPGVVRFDVLQEKADPTRFVLLEVYRGPEGAAAHKTTAHYQAWRDTVAPMMAEPRNSTSFQTCTPGETYELDARLRV